jgi:subtilisin-like proprotein convertase family protein
MKLPFFYSLALFGAMTVSAAENTQTNAANTLIPDANPTGIFSTIDINDVPGWIDEITLSLHVSGGFSGDFYAYLSAENGGFAVLLNRVGKIDLSPFGYEDSGLNITFSDSAEMDVHLYGGVSGGILTGIWQPDGRNVDPQNVLDTDSRTATLSAFTSLNPNGRWTLFVADMAGAGEGTLVEWSLILKTIPEPSALSFAMLGSGLWLIGRRKQKTLRR